MKRTILHIKLSNRNPFPSCSWLISSCFSQSKFKSLFLNLMNISHSVLITFYSWNSLNHSGGRCLLLNYVIGPFSWFVWGLLLICSLRLSPWTWDVHWGYVRLIVIGCCNCNMKKILINQIQLFGYVN